MTETRKFRYTISELIKALSSFPPNLPVLTSGYENGYENFQEPVFENLVHKSDAPYYDGEFQPAGEKDNDNFQAVVLARLVRDNQ